MDKRKLDTIVKHEASLVNIVKILQEDAEGGNEQSSFLGHMRSFVNDFYVFS